MSQVIVNYVLGIASLVYAYLMHQSNLVNYIYTVWFGVLFLLIGTVRLVRYRMYKLKLQQEYENKKHIKRVK